MDDIFKSYVSIAVSLILFGLILAFVVYVSQSANMFFRAEQQEREIKNEMMSYRELYEYRNKDVSGDDVLLTVKKYTRIYDIDIELGGVDSGSWLVLDTNGTDGEWNVERIRGIMGDNVYDGYYSQLVQDEAGVVTKITFTRK